MVQYHFLPALLLASNLHGLAYAQTYTTCNPTLASCPSNPGLQQKELTLDFTKVKSLPAEWTTENQGKAVYDASGANLILSKPNDSLNIISNFYMLFGSISFKVRAASGKGIVSSLVLISDALDEVDWEIVSKNDAVVESNYFGKGDTGVFDRGAKHPAPDNQHAWHTYRLDWTPDAVTWSIDGAAVRTLRYADAKGGSRFPQTPMRIKIGAWAAGDGANEKGVVEWAGGPTEWSAAPFTMAVESVSLVNYSPAKEYIYSDRSGSWESIKLVDGSLMSNAGSAPAPLPSAEVPKVAPSSDLPPPPPIASLKPSSLSSLASSVSPVTASVGASSRPASTVASTVSSTVRANATATLSKPAVATTNAAARSVLASGTVFGALAMALMPVL